MWLRMRFAPQITLPPTAAASDAMGRVLPQPGQDSLTACFHLLPIPLEWRLAMSVDLSTSRRRQRP